MSGEAKKFTLAQLAELTHSELVGEESHKIAGVEALELATSEDASFLANPRYHEAMLHSQAGVICVEQSISLPPGRNFLVCQDPSQAFQQIAEAFISMKGSGFSGIHPTAVIHPSVKLGKDVSVGPYVVIDQECTIGDETQIGPFVSIGPEVHVGERCHFYAHVVIREQCLIGNRVLLQPGAIIGSCGFGYLTSAKGKHIKLQQLGRVVLEDDVEIGANTTVDRARFKETRIGQGTKIDNLVQIGHNVMIGADNIIVAQTGIAGSAKTGKHVIIGGQAGIVGHVEIPSNTMIATRGGVSKSLSEAGKYGGAPVMPMAQHNRQQVHLRKIEEYVRRIEELEKKVSDLSRKP